MRKKETPNPSRVRGRGVEVSETLFYPKIICQNIFPANITTREFNQGTSYPLLQGGYLAIPAYSIQEVKDLPYPACGADMAKSFVQWYCQY